MSPLMKQYFEIKENYKDCILFFRVGDFYEMFYDDALLASKELEIALTGKDCGEPEKAPLCGVPFHSYEGYLTTLVNKGYNVAICEQVEDPALAKGLVKREVIRVVTPGTNTNTSAMEAGENTYILSVIYTGTGFGIAAADITTGDFKVTEIDKLPFAEDEILKYMPKEIICNPVFLMSGADVDAAREKYNVIIRTLSEQYFDTKACEKTLKEHFNVCDLKELGLENEGAAAIAAGSLLLYLYETQKISLIHLSELNVYESGHFMVLDSSTRRNLELTETLREKEKRGSLLWVLDKTRTAMGARALRNAIEQPLIDRNEINERLDAVEEWNLEIMDRDEIREYLGAVYDLERLLGRISYKSANPRDLIALKSSLEMMPHVKNVLKARTSALIKNLEEKIDGLEDITALIESAIVDAPPLAMKDGGIIKEGYNPDVDELRKAKTDGRNWLNELEERERSATGIKNLRIKYSGVFGYSFEVTNSYKELVPAGWMRKQTLTNAERYTTEELKNLEDKILNAEDRLRSLEYELFSDIRDRICSELIRIQTTAKAVAMLDMITALSYVATNNRYVRPRLNRKGIINIKNGRHPVVEKLQKNDVFVANDTFLDNQSQRIAIITGPNMAGKSTYMRQTALIVLMAQIGSFVPAENADICIVDRIFTRVGASDDLASGQSTFMVEMNEVANILKNATKNSLLILDEIGRGTSTFDGLAIAWAVVEHIANPKLLGSKTLFATHYHELTELEGKLESVVNYCIAVKEQGDDIVFLRKIVRGGADKSYGIQVARLAGLPDTVIKRAHEISEQLSENDLAERAGRVRAAVEQVRLNSDSGQLSLFEEDEDNKEKKIIDELRSMNLSNITPLEAITKLYDLQLKLK